MSSWFLTRFDTNQAVQPQEMARGVKLQIWKVEGLYYLCSKKKGADQPLVFTYAKIRFSHDATLLICHNEPTF